MPWPLGNLSKRDIRDDVATEIGDHWPVETSSAGGAGGDTAVIASLADTPVNALINRYLLMTEGNNDGSWRRVASVSGSTLTVAPVFSSQVLSAMSANLYAINPTIYTQAINAALRELFPAVYRPILHHTFVRHPDTQRTLPLPRDMERVMRLSDDRIYSTVLRDFFNRTANTTDPGDNWNQLNGTFGINSAGMYCSSDEDGDFVLQTPSPQLYDGVVEFYVRGDTTNGASRVFALVFRVVDELNFALAVRLINNEVQLRKLDTSVWSTVTSASVTTTENVDYVVRVMFAGSWISVWVDDRQYIHHELTGTDLRYLGVAGDGFSGGSTFGGLGFRLEKDGSPSLTATQTRIGQVFAHRIVGTEERGDWQRMPGSAGRTIEMRTLGRGRPLVADRMLWLEGSAPLTNVGADTTVGTLATDTTDVVEIKTDDPAYRILVHWAAFEVLRTAAQHGYTQLPDKRTEYTERAKEQLAIAKKLRDDQRMPYPQRKWG